MGKIAPTDEFKARYVTDKVGYTDEIPTFLTAMEENAVLLTMHGLNTDSGDTSIPTKFEGMDAFTCNKVRYSGA
jgi:hypothetical protein